MRKFILIAGFVFASAAAQAGDRSLSLGGGETTTATAPAKATDASKSAEARRLRKRQNMSSGPRSSSPRLRRARLRRAGPETSNTERARRRAAGMQRYANRPASAGPGKPSASAQRAAMMSRSAGAAPHALRDPGAHHHGTASARDLLVRLKLPIKATSCAGLVPGIHVFFAAASQKGAMRCPVGVTRP